MHECCRIAAEERKFRTVNLLAVSADTKDTVCVTPDIRDCVSLRNSTPHLRRGRETDHLFFAAGSLELLPASLCRDDGQPWSTETKAAIVTAGPLGVGDLISQNVKNAKTRLGQHLDKRAECWPKRISRQTAQRLLRTSFDLQESFVVLQSRVRIDVLAIVRPEKCV
jgi:hypothetical protein